jgi:hypothetical protein
MIILPGKLPTMKKIQLTIVVFLFATIFTKAQYIITTFAGTGNENFSGDGGLAPLADLNGSGGVDLGNSGEVYIADKYNERVRVVNTSNIISTFAGDGTSGFGGDGGAAISANFSAPTGVAVGHAANTVFITDYFNNRVRKVTGGIISTFAGNGSLGFSGDGGLATSASLYYPYEVATDIGGNVYICDRYNHRVRKVANATGIITTIAGNGSAGYSGDGGAATSASLNYPSAVYVDPFGIIYIADQENQRVRKISGGIITTVAGNGIAGFSGDGGPATSAQLYSPHGIFVDGAGNLYIADSDNNRVRKVSSGGIITTIAGTGVGGYSGDGGLGTAAQLTYPTKVAVSNSGLVYVADYNNDVIRLLTPMVGIDENSGTENLGIYPNPGDGIFSVVVPSSLNLTGSKMTSVTNLLGEVVWSKEIYLVAGSPLVVDITDQPSGIYFIHIGSSIQRIVKL